MDDHRRTGAVAGSVDRRDHDRARAVGLETVVEEAQRLGDPARREVLVDRERLRRASSLRDCGWRDDERRRRPTPAARECRRTRGSSVVRAARSRRRDGAARTVVSIGAGGRRGSATCDHGRLAAAPRFRLRHATATVHCPVATAIAAWPTTPHPAPPPYPTWLKKVMSPNPRLRAMSASSVVSSVYDAMPSTSPRRDAGVVERQLDRLQREVLLGAVDGLRELGLPDAGDRGPVPDRLWPCSAGAPPSASSATRALRAARPAG